MIGAHFVLTKSVKPIHFGSYNKITIPALRHSRTGLSLISGKGGDKVEIQHASIEICEIFMKIERVKKKEKGPNGKK